MGETICISCDDAAKFVAAARKIRDGFDDFNCRTAALEGAAGELSKNCLALAEAAHKVDKNLVVMLATVAAAYAAFGQTIGEAVNDMRAGADEFSRKVRTIELETRRAAQ